MKAVELLGNDLMLFVEGKAIALATNHTLTMTTEMRSTSNKDTGNWAASVPGIKSWECSSDNVYGVDEDGGTTQQSYDKLVDMWLNDEKVKINFGVPANANANEEVPDTGWSMPEGSYEGDAYITNITANAPNGENATFTVSLTGTGQLKKVTTE